MTFRSSMSSISRCGYDILFPKKNHLFKEFSSPFHCSGKVSHRNSYSWTSGTTTTFYRITWNFDGLIMDVVPWERRTSKEVTLYFDFFNYEVTRYFHYYVLKCTGRMDTLECMQMWDKPGNISKKSLINCSLLETRFFFARIQESDWKPAKLIHLDKIIHERKTLHWQCPTFFVPIFFAWFCLSQIFRNLKYRDFGAIFKKFCTVSVFAFPPQQTMKQITFAFVSILLG